MVETLKELIIDVLFANHSFCQNSNEKVDNQWKYLTSNDS